MIKDRYELGGLLWEQSSGQVFRAVDLQHEKPVNLKILAAVNDEERAAFARTFEQEVGLLAGLKHQVVPEILDHFEVEGAFYVVTEAIEGKSLADIVELAQKPIKYARVLSWAEQLLEGLGYMHSQDPPVLVRAITPHSIIRTPDNEIKLIDFELARQAGEGDRTRASVRGVGSRTFAPLEQYDFTSTTGPHSDIYSLGATLVYTLTGHEPPPATSRAALGAELPDIRALNESVPAAAAECLSDMMAIAVNMRPEAFEALERLRQTTTV